MRLPALLLTLTLASSLSAQDADTDPAAYFPDDSNVFAGVRDLSNLYDLDEDHPLKELGRHPAMKHVFGEFSDQMSSILDEEFLTDIGMTEEELAKAFPGRFAVGFRLDLDFSGKADIEGLDADEDRVGASAELNFNTVDPDIAVIADCTLTEDQLAELIEGMILHSNRPDEDAPDDAPEQNYSLVRERADGVTLFRIEQKSDGEIMESATVFTLVDGVLVVGPVKKATKGLGDSYLADVVRRVESGGREKDALSADDDYLDAAERFEEADVFFYAPLTNLAESLESMIVESYEQAEEDGTPLGMFATKDALLNFIGLGDFKSLVIAGTIIPEGMEIFQELEFNERRGILAKLLRYDDGGIEMPDFAPEGLTAINVSSLDIGGFLNELLAAVKTMSPMAAGALDMQLAELAKQGLSIREGMMGSLAPGISSFAGYASDEIPEDKLPSQLFVLKLSDPAGMDAALAGLRAYLSKMGIEEPQKREFMGESVYKADELVEALGAMVDLPEDSSASYAVVGSHLFIAAGEKNFMEHCITSFKEKGADLEDDPAIEEAWNRGGKADLVEFNYQDMASFILSVVLSTEASIEFSAEPGDEPGEAIESLEEAIEDFPSVKDLHYYIASKTYNTPDSWFASTVIAKKPE